MAKGFGVQPTEFIDYMPAKARGTSAGGSKSSPFGQFEVLPEDYAHLDAVLNEYTAPAEEMIAQIQQNPSDYKRFLPQVRQLSVGLQKDLTRGRIAAMVERKKKYDDTVKEIMARSDLDTEDKMYMVDGIVIEDFMWDPTTPEGLRGGRVHAGPFREKFAPSDQTKLMEDLTNNIKETVLTEPELERLGVLGATAVGSISHRKGIVKDAAIQAYMKMIPPERAKALQSRREWRRDNGFITEEEFELIDETKILNDDGTLNTETTLGKLIDGYAEAIAHETLQARGVTDKASAKAQKAAPASSYNRLHDMIMKVLKQDSGFREVIGKLPGKGASGVSSIEIIPMQSKNAVFMEGDGGRHRVTLKPFELVLLDKNSKEVKRIVVDGPGGAEQAYWDLFHLLANNPNEPEYSREAMEEMKRLGMAGKTMSDEILTKYNQPQGYEGGNTIIEENNYSSPSNSGGVLIIE